MVTVLKIQKQTLLRFHFLDFIKRGTLHLEKEEVAGSDAEE